MVDVETVYPGLVVGLTVALVVTLLAWRIAGRRARRAEADAGMWEVLAMDPIGARLHRLDMEIARLGR